MSNGAGNISVSVPISARDDVAASSASGASWGGFGGTWIVNQKGSGIQPWMLAAAVVAYMLLKQRKG